MVIVGEAGRDQSDQKIELSGLESQDQDQTNKKMPNKH